VISRILNLAQFSRVSHGRPINGSSTCNVGCFCVDFILTVIAAQAPDDALSMMQFHTPPKKIDGRTVYLDGNTDVPTVLYRGQGYSAEYVFSYPLEPNGIQVNSTHAVIPLGRKLQATYIRYMQGLRRKNVGVANQRFFPQPQGGMFGTQNRIGTAEKLFAFSQLGKVKKSDLMKASQRTKSPNNEMLSKNTPLRNLRTTQTALFSLGGLQMASASGIPDVALRQHVQNNDPSDTSRDMMHKGHEEMKSFFENETNVQRGPTSSFLGCTHWDNVLINLTTMTVAFPLNKSLSTYKGSSASYPWTAQDLLQGASFWRYHEETHRVEFQFSASIHSHWPDPEGFDRDSAPFSMALTMV